MLKFNWLEVLELEKHETVSFELGGLYFEYDKVKQEANIRKHGISFRAAARVFFDDNYIEAYDNDIAVGESRYDIIGDASVAGRADGRTVIGNVENFAGDVEDILYVVYTEREAVLVNDQKVEVIRLISARLANDFERGLYYGKIY